MWTPGHQLFVDRPWFLIIPKSERGSESYENSPLQRDGEKDSSSSRETRPPDPSGQDFPPVHFFPLTSLLPCRFWPFSAEPVFLHLLERLGNQ